MDPSGAVGRFPFYSAWAGKGPEFAKKELTKDMKYNNILHGQNSTATDLGE